MIWCPAEPGEDGAEVMSSEMLSDAVMVASSILSAQAGQTESRSVKLATALAGMAGNRSTIVVRLTQRRAALYPSVVTVRLQAFARAVLDRD